MTKLNPLEEALFQAWTRANDVQNHDDPSNYFDHRGLFKASAGHVQPRGTVNSLADTHNAAMEPQDSGQADMMKHHLEVAKLAHTSIENHKDRQHQLQLEHMKAQAGNAKLQLEHMKAGQKAQADQQKVQTDHAKLQAQSSQATHDIALEAHKASTDHQLQAHQILTTLHNAHNDRMAQAQQSQADRQVQVAQAQADRSHEADQAEADRTHEAKQTKVNNEHGLEKELVKRKIQQQQKTVASATK